MFARLLSLFGILLFASSLFAGASEVAPATPTTLNDAIFTKPYQVQLSFQVTGAYPFTFSIVGGALPSCLSLSPEALVSGTPSISCRGTYAFTVAATDFNGVQTTQRYVLHITDGKTVVVQTPASAPVPASASAPAPKPAQTPTPVSDPAQAPEPDPAANPTPAPKPPHAPSAPAPADSTTSSVPSPTTPTISSMPMGDDKSFKGKAQAQDKNYASVTLFVCVEDRQPSGKLDCSKASDVIQQNIQASAEGTTVKSVPVGADGSFTVQMVNPLAAGSYLYVTEVATPTDKTQKAISATSAQILINAPFSRTAPLGVAAAGLDVTGAASADSTAVFLGLGLLDIPLMNRNRDTSAKDFEKKLDKDIVKAPWWLTGDVRISGMAQPQALTSAQANTAGLAGYLATALTATPDSIVRSIDSTVSLAFNPPKLNWRLPVGSLDVGSYTTAHLPHPETLVTLSLMANVGAITPLSAKQASPQVFNLTSQVWQYLQNNPQLPISSTIPDNCNPASTSPATCYVAFVPQDRSRFYRNYSAGLRFKIYPGDYNANQYRFPGMAEVTMGQNEYVTGGRLSRWVLHTGGVMPLPQLDGFYIFGSMDTGFEKNKIGQQLLLNPATSTLNLTPISTGVYDVTVPQPNRDRYSFGFAVDIAHLYTAYKTSQAKKTAAAATNSSQ